MRTRRLFQPSLDCMPIRIAPSGGMLKAAIAPAITAVVHPAVESSLPSGLTSHVAPAIHSVIHPGGAIPEDILNPQDTVTGEGSTETIIQPVTVPSILIC
jgi:hypothetical protein